MSQSSCFFTDFSVFLVFADLQLKSDPIDFIFFGSCYPEGKIILLNDLLTQSFSFPFPRGSSWALRSCQSVQISFFFSTEHIVHLFLLLLS